MEVQHCIQKLNNADTLHTVLCRCVMFRFVNSIVDEILWTEVFQKLMVIHLVKKLPIFHQHRRFSAVFAVTRP